MALLTESKYCKVCGALDDGHHAIHGIPEDVYKLIIPPMPDIVMDVYWAREDLQTAFPEPYNMSRGSPQHGLVNLWHWAAMWGVREERCLKDLLISPVVDTSKDEVVGRIKDVRQENKLGAIDIHPSSKNLGGKKRVMVAIPMTVLGYFLQPEFIKNLLNIEINDEVYYYIRLDMYPESRNNFTGKENTRFDRRFAVSKAHEDCRKKFLESGCDYLLMLEHDVFPPSDAYLRMKSLIEEHGADVAFLSYTWHNAQPKGLAMVWLGTYPEYQCIYVEDYFRREYPIQVAATGFGCTMFTRKTLVDTAFRLDDENSKGWNWCTDGVFGRDAAEHGWVILGDNRTFCQHLDCPNCYNKVLPSYEDITLDLDKLFPEKNISVALRY